MMTRLKPAMRSTLVERGSSPQQVWLASWSELAARWRKQDTESAADLESVLALLPPCGHDQEVACGERVLRLLGRIQGMASR